MARPQPGRALGDVGGERFDVDAEVGQESLHDRHCLWSAAPWVHEHFGVGAGWEHEVFAPEPVNGGNRRHVMRIAGVEECDHDARVEDDYRHSRRSFSRAPFG